MPPAIITDPTHPVLRTPAAVVDRIDKDVRDTIHELLAAARQSVRPAIGLAAPQIGIPHRIIAVKLRDHWLALVNPIIEPEPPGHTPAMETALEGCLSLPNAEVRVPRLAGITVSALDAKGRRWRTRVHGQIARLFQHKIDHLDGVMIDTRAAG